MSATLVNQAFCGRCQTKGSEEQQQDPCKITQEKLEQNPKDLYSDDGGNTCRICGHGIGSHPNQAVQTAILAAQAKAQAESQTQAVAPVNDAFAKFRSGKSSRNGSPNSDKSSSSGSSVSGSQRRRIDHSDEVENEGASEAMQKATGYVQSIMHAQEVSLDANLEISVLENISDIWTGGKFNVIVRSITQDFWQQCINTTNEGHRVCAVGTPGIGKSTSIPFLIKMLLEDDKVVVYLRRTSKETKWKYQFRKNDHGEIDVAVFPESTSDDKIPALRKSDTFYIVDPENTKDDSNPTIDLPAKVIIVSSVNSDHWGGNEFQKKRTGYEGGLFLYMPLWEFGEMQVAKALLNSELSDQDLISRFRMFGGVPRKVFARANVLGEAMQAQETGINDLTSTQAYSLFRGDIHEVDSHNPNAPSSAVVGYRSIAPFASNCKEVVIISDSVKEKICKKHLKQLWKAMEKSPKSGIMGDSFEVYVRLLMLDLPKAGQEFDSRLAVGKTHSRRTRIEKLTLPRCDRIEQAHDILAAVRDASDDLVVYHPVSEVNPLVDFIFKHESIFYAVQVTIGKKHDAETDKIERMLSKLKLATGKTVVLLYAVPAGHFETFTTDPVEPAVSRCPVKVISILNPGENIRQH